MSSKFRFDDKSLQQQILHACAELKNTDVCDDLHIFSDRMRARMSDTLRKERRYRLWQKAKMVLAVILTLLVAAGMIYGRRQYNRIMTQKTLDEYLASDTGDARSIGFTDELKQYYRVSHNTGVVIRKNDNSSNWWGYARLNNLENNLQVKIEYYPAEKAESPTSDYEELTVWGYPAALVGATNKCLTWTDEEYGVYFVVTTSLPRSELFRVVNNIIVK